ncbi:MAG TPA: toll/interleukin-1 receptor domain-containing protein [Pseudonocardiaceae bacterium]|nr:toll/interleukin-1 receptor domain-containing protein [Pseudonocardiaceae bacterium]
MTRVFLSCTRTDADPARRLTEELTAARVDVFWWQNPRVGGMQFVRQLQVEIESADIFVVLLSPAYLESNWCLRELDMAVHRETELGRPFVYVCQVADTPHEGSGFLRPYDWLDLLPPIDDDKLAHVRTVIGLAQKSPEPVSTNGVPVFRNRQDEIGRIIDALTTRGGQELWLVLSPPRMGKSWFLAQLEKSLQEREPAYASRLVDLRAHPATLRTDWVRLLCTLLDVDPPATPALSDGDRIAIAAAVSNRSRPQLYLLDSAELLPADTVDRLRTELTAIHRLVDRAGNHRTRLCVVVASRHQDPWRGFGPGGGSLLFETLALTEFRVSVFRQVIDEQNLQIGNGERAQWAEALHGLSEGLPALLVAGLAWARRTAFLSREDCVNGTAFDEVARPYIAADLLAAESLLPFGDGGLPQRKNVLERALKVIAPYRLFTQSHLAHHVSGDVAFGHALDAVGWELADLWEALSRTALLKQPSEEIWQVLSPPIRRLLFRYYYPDDTARRQAHVDAHQFYEKWAEATSGTDRGAVLVECLWHEATTLLLSGPDDLPALLPVRAADLTRAFVRPEGYTPPEFAGFVRNRLQRDPEFATLVSPYPGLFEDVLASVYATIAGGA